jgi:anti-sigma-K factor RskA
MTQKPYDSYTENIPAYVLGALSREEASALQTHLKTCEACQAEWRRYQQIGDGLLAGIFPQQAPAAAAKRKLLAALAQERPPTPARSRWGFRQLAMGTLALALLALNAAAFLQIRDLRKQQTQLASQVEKNHTILGMLTTSTEIHPIRGDGLSGNLLLDREKNLSYLLVWNLSRPPEDRVYQIWLVSPEGERIGAGLFRPEEDRPLTSAALATSRSLDQFVGMEVTIEPVGGSNIPTGEQILSVSY